MINHGLLDGILPGREILLNRLIIVVILNARDAVLLEHLRQVGKEISRSSSVMLAPCRMDDAHSQAIDDIVVALVEVMAREVIIVCREEGLEWRVG
jgi:hypothetical protein